VVSVKTIAAATASGVEQDQADQAQRHQGMDAGEYGDDDRHWVSPSARDDDGLYARTGSPA
jgi:hypothetical protein